MIKQFCFRIRIHGCQIGFRQILKGIKKKLKLPANRSIISEKMQVVL